jgi:hypothetical protein
MTQTVRERVAQDENTAFLASLVESRIASFGEAWRDTLSKIEILNRVDSVEASKQLQSFSDGLGEAVRAVQNTRIDTLIASLPPAGAWPAD